MSGGHFDYKQHSITDIADAIEHAILNNNSAELDQWGYRKGYGYSKLTIEQLANAVSALRIAAVYAQRADYLLSGDDGEESFVQRLSKELGVLS